MLLGTPNLNGWFGLHNLRTNPKGFHLLSIIPLFNRNRIIHLYMSGFLLIYTCVCFRVISTRVIKIQNHILDIESQALLSVICSTVELKVGALKLLIRCLGD